MNRIYFLLTLLIFAVACKNQGDAKHTASPLPGATAAINDSANFTTVEWLDAEQNFGKVIDGETVLITFHFKNTGTKPLIIANVQASCGCTVPSKPEEPIAPGQEGLIKAEFNSSGREGIANKTLTVTCNTKEQIHTLNFNGEVLSKNKQQTK
jgi:hypothetical protein